VTIGAGASIWYGAVLRGDLDPIVIGEGSNVQDNSVLHTGRGEPCIIEDFVSIGHMACVHGCRIGRGSLVGIMATVLNRSVIGENCIVGAKALVAEDKIIAAGSLVLGVPAKVVRVLTEEEIATVHDITRRYVTNGDRHRAMIAKSGAEFGWSTS
jgi:carbonic anhydrase/acetyltransferase-like protein (isoleucine patch superfamily)